MFYNKNGDSMKKGFTLTELVAAVTLLALLVSFVLPKVLNIYDRKQNDIKKAKEKLIYSAADEYIENSINLYPTSAGSRYCIKIEDIDKENLIPSDVSDVIEKAPLVFVKVGMNDKKNYSLVGWNEVTGDNCSKTP